MKAEMGMGNWLVNTLICVVVSWLERAKSKGASSYAVTFSEHFAFGGATEVEPADILTK